MDKWIEALAEQWENDIKYYAKMHTLYCQRRHGASGRNVSRALKEMSACHAKELRDLLETMNI